MSNCTFEKFLMFFHVVYLVFNIFLVYFLQTLTALKLLFNQNYVGEIFAIQRPVIVAVASE